MDLPYKPKGNTFHLLRLVAASLVLFHHCYVVTGQALNEPLTKALQDIPSSFKANSLGALGVNIFFVISGYLVTASYLRKAEGYHLRRMRRILPALVVNIIFCIFVIGPLFTRLPLGTYLTYGGTYIYLANIFLFPIQMIRSLPGVFDTSAFTLHYANVPLWTLPWEAICYCAVPLFIQTHTFSREKATYLAAIIFLIAWQYPDTATYLPGLSNCVYFFGGALLWRHGNRPIFRTPSAIFAFILLIAGYMSGMYVWLNYILIPYLVIYIAMHSDVFSKLSGLVRGDYSYGVYIYAWPIQQALVAVSNNHLSPMMMLALSFPITLIPAMLSWHFVESRWLRKGKR